MDATLAYWSDPRVDATVDEVAKRMSEILPNSETQSPALHNVGAISSDLPERHSASFLLGELDLLGPCFLSLHPRMHVSLFFCFFFFYLFFIHSACIASTWLAEHRDITMKRIFIRLSTNGGSLSQSVFKTLPDIRPDSQ